MIDIYTCFSFLTIRIRSSVYSEGMQRPVRPARTTAPAIPTALRSDHRRSERPSRSQPLPSKLLRSSPLSASAPFAGSRPRGATSAPARSTLSRVTSARSNCSSLVSTCCPPRRTSTCAPRECTSSMCQKWNRSSAAGSSQCGRAAAAGSTRRSSSSPTRQPPGLRTFLNVYEGRVQSGMPIALLQFPMLQFCFDYEKLGQSEQYEVSYCVSGEKGSSGGPLITYDGRLSRSTRVVARRTAQKTRRAISCRNPAFFSHRFSMRTSRTAATLLTGICGRDQWPNHMTIKHS